MAREAFRLLRPGGRIAVWTPHEGHFLELMQKHHVLLHRDPGHVDYKCMERVCGYLSDVGFSIVRAYYAPSHVPVLRTAERLLQAWTPWLRRRIAVLAVRPPG